MCGSRNVRNVWNVNKPEEAKEKSITILRNAHTGLPDDGRIYVSPVEEALRIRTGERGESAV